MDDISDGICGESKVEAHIAAGDRVVKMEIEAMACTWCIVLRATHCCLHPSSLRLFFPQAILVTLKAFLSMASKNYRMYAHCPCDTCNMFWV